MPRGTVRCRYYRGVPGDCFRGLDCGFAHLDDSGREVREIIGRTRPSPEYDTSYHQQHRSSDRSSDRGGDRDHDGFSGTAGSASRRGGRGGSGRGGYHDSPSRRKHSGGGERELGFGSPPGRGFHPYGSSRGGRESGGHRHGSSASGYTEARRSTSGALFSPAPPSSGRNAGSRAESVERDRRGSLGMSRYSPSSDIVEVGRRFVLPFEEEPPMPTRGIKREREEWGQEERLPMDFAALGVDGRDRERERDWEVRERERERARLREKEWDGERDMDMELAGGTRDAVSGLGWPSAGGGNEMDWEQDHVPSREHRRSISAASVPSGLPAPPPPVQKPLAPPPLPPLITQPSHRRNSSDDYQPPTPSAFGLTTPRTPLEEDPAALSTAATPTLETPSGAASTTSATATKFPSAPPRPRQFTSYTPPTYPPSQTLTFTSEPDFQSFYQFHPQPIQAIHFLPTFHVLNSHIRAIAESSHATTLLSLQAGDSETGSGCALMDDSILDLLERARALKVLILDSAIYLTDLIILTALKYCKEIEYIRVSGNDIKPGKLSRNVFWQLGRYPKLKLSLKRIDFVDQAEEETSGIWVEEGSKCVKEGGPVEVRIGKRVGGEVRERWVWDGREVKGWVV